MPRSTPSKRRICSPGSESWAEKKGARPKPGAWKELALDLDDVRGLQGLRDLGRPQIDHSTLRDRLEAVAGDAREVHEEISTTIGRRDEAVALGVAEPLDSSGCHDTSFDESRTRTEGDAAQPVTRSD